MNETTGLRQRSKRTKKLIIAGAMALAVGGFGVAITLPANAASGSFCATKACKNSDNKGTKKGATKKTFTLTGQGKSPSRARTDLEDKCAQRGGTVVKITKQFSKARGTGVVAFAEGTCVVGEKQNR